MSVGSSERGTAPVPEGVSSDLVLMDIVRMFIRRQRILLLPVLVMTLLAVIGLWQAPILYTATIKVAPPIDESEFSGLNRSRSSSGGLPSVAAFLPGLNAQGDPAFTRFQELLTSVRLADVLMADPHIAHTLFGAEWNAKTQAWQPPSGWSYTLRQIPKSIFGVGGWAPPNAKRLSERLIRKLETTKEGGTSTLAISFSHRDRAFALDFLLRVYREAEGLMRMDGAAQARIKRDFISRRLGRTSLSELRTVLIDLMAEVEKQEMLLAEDLPYAVELVDLPQVSDLPTSPRPLSTLFLFAFGGGIIGILCVLTTEMLIGAAPIRRPRRSSSKRTSTRGPAPAAMAKRPPSLHVEGKNVVIRR